MRKSYPLHLTIHNFIKFLQMLEMNTLARRFTDKIVAEENTPEEIVVTPSEDKRVTKAPTEMLRMLVLCCG